MGEILYEIRERYAVITIQDEKTYNSLNKDLINKIIYYLNEAELDVNVRAILLTGVGKAFSAGQNLQVIIQEKLEDFESIVRDQYNPLVLKIRDINKPVIAAVNGVAAGAGANLALVCDVVLAHENAKFIQAFSQIGLIPDTAGTFVLPRLIGFQRAMGYMLTGEPIMAQEALKMGLVYKVYEGKEYHDSVIAFMEKVSAMPTLGIAYTKKLLNLSMNNTLEQQLEAEADYQNKAGHTEDFKEGVQAFVEKRKPIFKGK